MTELPIHDGTVCTTPSRCEVWRITSKLVDPAPTTIEARRVSTEVAAVARICSTSSRDSR